MNNNNNNDNQVNDHNKIKTEMNNEASDQNLSSDELELKDKILR